MKTCPVCDTDYSDQHTTCATDGAMLIVSQEFAPGSLVRGKYRIVRKLGQGGMGVVYLAEDSLLGVKVALKFLAGDLGKDPRFIKRFRTEARAAYQLRHPNIVEVTSLDQAEDGSLFIAMEYIEGPSLRAVLDQNPNGLAIPRALDIAKGIASGLAAAHAQGTIHRDIKPENILLTCTKEGIEVAKVLDFGIAAVAESVTRMTRTQGFILTYAYAAPEQWHEMPANQMDGRTDLYALGCVLYEMLTGTTPFHAHTTAGWMKAHCEESPKPPSTLRPELAQWANLDALSAILLTKNRDRRPAEALELLSLLQAVREFNPQPKEKNVVREQETVIETSDTRPALKGNLFENGRWKIYAAIGISAILFTTVFLYSFLPYVALEACLNDCPDLAQASARLFEHLPYLRSNDLDKNALWQCGSRHKGDECLSVADAHDSEGKFFYSDAQSVELGKRAIIILKAQCFSGSKNGYALCTSLGQAYYQPGFPGEPTRTVQRSRALSTLPQDPQLALAAFLQGCELGEGESCESAGDMYASGSGVDKDKSKAENLYRKACQNDFHSCDQMNAKIAALRQDQSHQPVMPDTHAPAIAISLQPLKPTSQPSTSQHLHGKDAQAAEMLSTRIGATLNQSRSMNKLVRTGLEKFVVNLDICFPMASRFRKIASRPTLSTKKAAKTGTLSLVAF